MVFFLNGFELFVELLGFSHREYDVEQTMAMG
jgi:hypothetical protein